MNVGKGVGLVGLALGDVGDDAGVEVDGHLVAVLRCFSAGLGALQDGQADVDGVAVEDAGEGLGDDAGDAGWP